MIEIPSPYKEELHTALCAVKDGQRRADIGICGSVRYKLYEVFTYEGDLDSAERHLTEAMLTWPDKFDSRSNPVGGYDEYVQEVRAGTIWQNPRRLALLDYLIEQTA